MFTTDRKSSYKLPPTTIRDKLVSQEARRSKALEEQKRRRAQKIDSSRQLDMFADLSLAEHSDEDESETVPAPTSVAAYVSLLQKSEEEEVNGIAHKTNVFTSSSSTFEYPSHQAEASNSASASYLASKEQHPIPVDQVDESTGALTDAKKPRKRGGKNSHKRRSEANKASNSHKYKGGSSKWADKCMYAELLEMHDDEVWDGNGDMGYDEQDIHDGLPRDLETGWVAIAPVPKGKRCLVVTQQSAGVAGVVPNTTLRSRLLGKFLLPRFPSTLPPLTVLDCILDNNWRENGILHVLDVVRWKGQDVADCEAGFRFWWRDTRLAELPQIPPPSFHFVSLPSSSASTGTITLPHKGNDEASNSQSPRYYFPYPTTFIPVPYHSNTNLPTLDTHVIPAARSVREVPIVLPSSIHSSSFPSRNSAESTIVRAEGEMEIESTTSCLNPSGINGSDTALMPTTAFVQPDGLLLYVAEASYEPGTSPLSSWIPIRGYDETDNTVEGVKRQGPLDLFQRLVRKRLNKKAVFGQGLANSTVDVEMEL
ncbi:hypothetical protein BDN70DRAFT_881919 [Pholiota conissans]|uniref:Snurportin-1 n=1 Tax=Pholiota conissans TaxID=109636 RepID=A0A9P5YYC9_9AGAR|nr:hypothetical protein BDN70DRAFT_881919 [Pholiota conissans]